MTLGDFTNQAQAYSKSRPGYPAELIDQLLIDAGLHPLDQFSQRKTDTPIPNPSHIATQRIGELGAGTGILTRMLVERGFEVTAVEPNESMRRQANVPEARWVAGTFEDSHVETASQDWVVAAQAFHWADPPRCLPEMRRILKPGCLFTVLWNNRSPLASDIVDWTQEAIRRLVPKFDEVYRSMDTRRVLESTGDFTFVGKREAIHTVVMSRQRYLDLWQSHNHLNTIAGPQRFQRFFRELSEYLDQQRIEQVNVRYNCEAWSARRNDELARFHRPVDDPR